MLHEFITLSSGHLKFISFLSKALSESKMPEELVKSIWDTIVRTFAEVQIVSKYGLDSEIIIMDEAFCQRCFTLFAYMGKPISDELISSYANMAPISDHVFRVATPPEKCMERLEVRYKNRPSPYGLGTTELLHDFESGNTILEKLNQVLETHGKSVHCIQGDSNLNESLFQIDKAGQGICLRPSGNRLK